MERTNWTLKETLSKWIIETDCSWMDLLPTALLRLRVTLPSQGYSIYDVYGRPPPIIKQVSTNLPQVRGDSFGWTLGVGEGQGDLVCCGSDTTEQLN